MTSPEKLLLHRQSEENTVISETPKRGRPRREREAARNWIQLRVTMSRKNAYVRAAKPKKLTKWIFEILDKASGYEPPEHD